ncbi:ribosomal protein S18-alanine N-acetyltransferase [Streptomyces sp. SID3343]|uniref:ribosomal protein S18-alanine N-acetyltransferase n=1 Tax=Streptomyces sp. SID3343 TaxID=2690260 RepID=UPI00136BC618|nr:ribosomal protein S18-alanine N-acetyltransferase [Streptomyces sp. SID3343]MYW02184.1 ribosomal protein S18-alanine N-acetyltransferase [Streptomyces sp. SID3343]
METAPRLRRMRWWDIEAVIRLEHDLFVEDAWSAGMFWSELAEPEMRHYMVAEDETGAMAGYAGLAVIGDEGDVQTIAVRRDRWGTGLGTVLLTDLLDRASERGCRDVLLEVRVDNARAQALYERFGFKGIGVRRGYYQPANVDALVMRCDLSERNDGDRAAGARPEGTATGG